MERMPNAMRVGGVALGEGMPKICVPVMGKTPQEICGAAARARAAGADLIELRIDSLSPMPTVQEAGAACAAARESGLPLLFTLRTSRDGGSGAAEAAPYEALLTGMARSGLCDAIDCELSVGEAAFSRIVRAAHGAGVPVVGSSHAFHVLEDLETPARWLAQQAALDADVLKAAVMTSGRVQALEAAWRMARAGETLGRPYIAITMGSEGAVSRVGCEALGSCLTFGTAGGASAPGQIPAGTLRTALEIFHAAFAQTEKV
ncbi:MAG: type I 3-dehydroquinate dehydratase [Candidatus Ventricola sp.]|nr:type I 3-dehydroquinate dehydratase [Candidatus Ventricola sp.]